MSRDKTIAVQLQKSIPDPASDPFIVFYGAVRHASAGLSYRNYDNFVAALFCPDDRRDLLTAGADRADKRVLPQTSAFHFRGTMAYDQLVEATSLFIASVSALVDDCCPSHEPHATELAPLSAASKSFVGGLLEPTSCDVSEIERRFAPGSILLEQLGALMRRLFDAPGSAAGECFEDARSAVGLPPSPGSSDGERRTQGAAMANDPLGRVTTFMQQLVENQPGVPLKDCSIGSGSCNGLLISRLRCPPMLELIWSYWMEQGMLVQGLNALTLRFQNRLFPGADGLRRFDISPLRPLNNVLWGYVQREQNRLSLARRSYEYDHHYGLRLHGQAVPAMAPADSRTQFIECFHRLLRETMGYYRLAMNTTLRPDAFPVLNALRDLHLVLAEGANNQFGDLPSTARAEMLVQQWLLARPEVREFLGGRPGVPYPEAWMPHMESLRQLMGWHDTSIRHYRDLATFGEQLLLSVRQLPWSNVTNATVADAWLTFWRPEVQGYAHAYRAVTGVDLSLSDQPMVAGGGWRTQPSDLIRNRRQAQPAGSLR